VRCTHAPSPSNRGSKVVRVQHTIGLSQHGGG
jgi:hypothetical protein